ncbi:MAG TPA: hypothetical protein VMV44_16055 [Rectinemataceae bacterium]|nr:hypothetical protein [Rectinemataceae bacterium]
MARTLFFLEATLLLVFSALFSKLGRLDAASFVPPLLLSLLLPPICASSIWPLSGRKLN